MLKLLFDHTLSCEYVGHTEQLLLWAPKSRKKTCRLIHFGESHVNVFYGPTYGEYQRIVKQQFHPVDCTPTAS